MLGFIDYRIEFLLHFIVQPAIHSVIMLYESGTNKLLSGSYCYLNVGTEEENKTVGNKGITINHFRGQEK